MARASAVIVLAGGGSTRMGAPKEWLDWGGRPMLAHVVERMAPLAPRTIVAAAPGQRLPALPGGVEVVADVAAGGGPLEGLRAGLHALEPGDVAVVCAGDMPLLHPALLRRVADLLGDAHEAAVPAVGGRLHPLAGAYRAALGRTISRRLAAGRGSVVGLLDACRTVTLGPADLLGDRELAAADPGLDGLRSANTPAELQAMREKATIVPAAPSAPSGSQASADAPTRDVTA